MADPLHAAIAKLRSEAPSAFTAAVETAIKLLQNVISHQDDPKYRRVRLTNAKLEKVLFSQPGGRDLLVAVGFVGDGLELELPASASMVRLLQSKAALEASLAPKAKSADPQEVATAPMDVDEGELAAALALSCGEVAAGAQEAGGEVPEDSDADDEDLAAAIALSQAPASARAPPSASDQSPPVARTPQEALQARVREIFYELTAAGMGANEAAAKALEMASVEAKQSPGTNGPPTEGKSEPGVPGAELLERAGFEARVKELFSAAVAAGKDANDAAAGAVKQAQAEQLKAAQRVRKARAPSDTATDTHDGAAPPDLAPQLSEDVETFERWEEIEKVAQAQVDAINVMYREEGVTFIDPSFPPTDRALYESTESSTTWKCRACGARSPLPPPPTAQELARMLTDRSYAERLIKCSKCQTECNELEVALRPTGWARPSELRDDVTLQFSTVPWVVVRDEPRPDDIRQGHVGNCWLVCAMSALAEEPANVRKLLLTAEYNPAGVYQVRLCKTGVWHCVVIDDVLPTNQLTCLAYLKAARRSLWGPLIEKAAAKLNGSYEALNGGTFSEAFGMLTGSAVQAIRLSKYDPPTPPLPGASEGELRQHEKRLARWTAKGYDYDELYAQLFSYKAAGFVIGCSTFFTKEADIVQARSVGIQVPHAYCLLELSTNPADESEQLVKLRNPNGHAGWRGDWSRGSSKWTYETKAALKIDQEDSGVFWMAWPDFIKYFAEVTICRLRPEYVEARQGGWLASVFGAGQAVAIEVYAHTQLELTLHQEAHTKRGESSFATHVDLGVAVMKVGHASIEGHAVGAGAGPQPLELVAYGERSVHSSISIDTTLESDGFTSRYLIVPTCFGHLASPEPRKFVAACLSNQVLSIETVSLQPKDLAAAAIAATCAHGEKSTLLSHPSLGEALNIYTLEEEAGYTLVAENLQPVRIRVEVDASEGSKGLISTRGALFCEDVLPPRSRMIVMILSFDMKSKTHAMGLRFGGGVLEPGMMVPHGAGHIPALGDLGPLASLHEPQPLPMTQGGFGTEATQPFSGADVAALASNIMSQMRPRPAP